MENNFMYIPAEILDGYIRDWRREARQIETLGYYPADGNKVVAETLDRLASELEDLVDSYTGTIWSQR